MSHIEIDLEFGPEDIALASIPGVNFDPRERGLDVDKLRPQPIIRSTYLIKLLSLSILNFRKRAKICVSEKSKDDNYWKKRCKNNYASKR